MAAAFRFQRGDHVLPNFPLFSRIVGHASREPASIAIRSEGISASYSQLLQDVLRLKKALTSGGQAGAKDGAVRQCTYVGLQVQGSYAFVVGFLAILAAGSIVVPISSHAAVAEMKHFIITCDLTTIVTRCGQRRFGNGVRNLGIIESIRNTPTSEVSPVISYVDYLDPTGPGVAIFTSGTTGPPKACVLPRSMVCGGTQSVADHFGLHSTDSILHCLPVHHAAGIFISILPFLQNGGCVEFLEGSFRPESVWQRWREGRFTAFTGVPTMYTRLMSYYETNIAVLAPDTRLEYIDGAKRLRLMLCGTSALPRPLRAKWSQLLGGKRILERYGSTELGGIILMSPQAADQVPEGSVGRPLPGAEVKLSNGDEGELLIKAPYMFSEYLGNQKATLDAHDSHGFFKTGDIARRENGYYFILGRASTDIIKSGGYKISALDIEREILGLDSIADVAVVGIDDEEYGQRVAAAIVPKPQYDGKINVTGLRNQLRTKLAGYKLPTILFVTADLPKNAMGKVQKKDLVKIICKNGQMAPAVQVWNSRPRSRPTQARL